MVVLVVQVFKVAGKIPFYKYSNCKNERNNTKFIESSKHKV